MPPRWRNHREATAGDTPTASPASSLENPLAISNQKARSISRRIGGLPGDLIAGRPVNVTIHPGCLPINTSRIKVLRRPVESAQYTSTEFAKYCKRNKIKRSLGKTGICYDNAVSESFFATYKNELIHSRPWPDLHRLRIATIDWINNYYNSTRRHSTLNYLTPAEYELGYKNIYELAA